jgi:hypothetical protein
MTFLGAVFVLNLALGPVVLSLSRATTIEFFTRFWPTMKKFLHASFGGTALFGILLYAVGGFSSGSPNALLVAGIVLGLIAIIEGEALQIPSVNKLIKLANQTGGASGQQVFSADEMKIFQKIKTGGIVGVVTITLAALLMIAAAWY